jgi:hypothetical protein
MRQPSEKREEPSRDGVPGVSGPAAALRRLRVGAILVTLGLILLLHAAREALQPFLQSWSGRLVMGGALFLGAVVLLGGMFHVVERLHAPRGKGPLGVPVEEGRRLRVASIARAEAIAR